MGRPRTNGAPGFRFHRDEVAIMESIFEERNGLMPTSEVFAAVVLKFSDSQYRRVTNTTVEKKQVYNWFKNKRAAIRARKSHQGESSLSLPEPHPNLELTLALPSSQAPVCIPVYNILSPGTRFIPVCNPLGSPPISAHVFNPTGPSPTLVPICYPLTPSPSPIPVPLSNPLGSASPSDVADPPIQITLFGTQLKVHGSSAFTS